MTKIFTPTTIAEIERLASAGADSRAIATALGLNLASLRVRCCQLGISFRKGRVARAKSLAALANARDVKQPIPSDLKHATALTLVHPQPRPKAKSRGGKCAHKPVGGSVPLVVVVPRLTLLQLRQLGAGKGMSPEALAAELLTVIGDEGLCKAILDDDAA